jgi:hypothetical protein
LPVKRSFAFVAASWVFAVLFAVCVLLQLNDPDPMVWMSMYGAAALSSAAVPHWRRGWVVAALVAVVAAVWGAALWSVVAGTVETSDLWRKMSEKGGRVEEMREAGGLTIVALWLGVAAGIGRRRTAAP